MVLADLEINCDIDDWNFPPSRRQERENAPFNGKSEFDSSLDREDLVVAQKTRREDRAPSSQGPELCGVLWKCKMPWRRGSLPGLISFYPENISIPFTVLVLRLITES